MDITEQVKTANQLFTDFDTSKLLLGNNSFVKADLTASGADVVLSQGDILGQISATGKVIVMKSAATDGSQFPFGVVIEDITIADGSTVELTLANKGKVNSALLNYDGTDDEDTAVGPASNQRTYKALLNDLGLELESSSELSGVDNS